MRIASLVIGILLMILAGIACIVFLALPSMTNNRVNFEESLLGLIPSIIILFLAFIMTLISVVFVIKAKKKVVQPN